MRSLSAHLAQPGSHGGLPFHPGCPSCRAQRLAGPPPRDTLISARTSAALVAGLLAGSSGAPAPVIAAEPDSEQQGAKDPGGPERSGGEDPGYEDSSEEDDEPLVEEGTPLDADDEGPVEQPPSREIPPDDSEVPAAERDGRDADGVAPGATPPPPPVGDERSTETPLATPESPPADAPRPRAEHQGAPPTLSPGRPEKARPEHGRKQAGAGVSPPASSQQAPGSQSGASSGTTGGEAARASDGPGANSGSGRRTYVVQAGDSLWSIAQDRLGRDASPAEVARLVNRLWELNSARIGTGDPDLIMVGTRLRLP